MEPFLGQICMFAGAFAPQNWAFCHGQILSISQYQALYSILGTMYGGNGVTTFALPDLRGRVPLGPGQGPGLQPYSQGQIGGVESVTLLSNQMPTHVHPTSVAVSSNAGNSAAPNGRTLAASDQRNNQYTDQGGDGNLAGVSSGMAGGNQPHENRQPYLSISFIIALEGVYPSRN